MNTFLVFSYEGEKVYIKGNKINAVLENSSGSDIVMEGDHIPYRVSEKIEVVLDMIIEMGDICSKY